MPTLKLVPRTMAGKKFLPRDSTALPEQHIRNSQVLSGRRCPEDTFWPVWAANYHLPPHSSAVGKSETVTM